MPKADHVYVWNDFNKTSYFSQLIYSKKSFYQRQRALVCMLVFYLSALLKLGHHRCAHILKKWI